MNLGSVFAIKGKGEGLMKLPNLMALTCPTIWDIMSTRSACRNTIADSKRVISFIDLYPF